MHSIKNKLKIKINLLLRIIGNLFIALFFFAILSLLIPYLFNLTPYFVMSGSMEETIHYGSVVYVKNESFGDIKPLDIATFQSEKDATKSFTHRVIEINNENRTFITKGDANPTPDPVSIGEDNLIGKVVFTIPCMGFLLILLENKLVFIITVVLLVLWVSVEIEVWLRKRKVRNGAK